MILFKNRIIFLFVLFCELFLTAVSARGVELEQGDAVSAPQIVPYLIQFNWGVGSKAITMYDPCTTAPIKTPEFKLTSSDKSPAEIGRASCRERV